MADERPCGTRAPRRVAPVNGVVTERPLPPSPSATDRLQVSTPAASLFPISLFPQALMPLRISSCGCTQGSLMRNPPALSSEGETCDFDDAKLVRAYFCALFCSDVAWQRRRGVAIFPVPRSGGTGFEPWPHVLVHVFGILHDGSAYMLHSSFGAMCSCVVVCFFFSLLWCCHQNSFDA